MEQQAIEKVVAEFNDRPVGSTKLLETLDGDVEVWVTKVALEVPYVSDGVPYRDRLIIDVRMGERCNHTKMKRAIQRIMHWKLLLQEHQPPCVNEEAETLRFVEGLYNSFYYSSTEEIDRAINQDRKRISGVNVDPEKDERKRFSYSKVADFLNAIVERELRVALQRHGGTESATDEGNGDEGCSIDIFDRLRFLTHLGLKEGEVRRVIVDGMARIEKEKSPFGVHPPFDRETVRNAVRKWRARSERLRTDSQN